LLEHLRMRYQSMEELRESLQQKDLFDRHS
jgi:hypothetical protein